MRLSKVGVFLLVLTLVFTTGCIFGKKEYTISGTVLDEDGKAIEDVVINITGDTTATVEDIDKDGKWSATVKGKVTVTPVHEQYEFEPEFKEVSKETDKLDFKGTQLKEYDISGIVVDDEGNPIKGAKIKITGQVEKDVVTDENGKWEAKDVIGTITIDAFATDPNNMYFFDSVEISKATSDIKLEGRYGHVVLYKFDETEGTIVKDSSNAGNDATLEGGATISEGILSLDGIDGHFNIPEGLIADLDNFTISFSVNVKELRPWSRFFDLAGPFGFVYMTPQGIDGLTSLTVFTNENSIYGPEHIFSDVAIDLIPTNTWVLVTVVFSNKEVTIYYDGELIGTMDAHAQPKDVGSTFHNHIGKSIHEQDPYLYADFDDFRIYNEALTAEQIADLYSLGE